ncbi:Type II site-specific deoxyribonuclease [Methanocaldococcus vulcanius M7]|uniref:type II site-specific deoxyribonuclease n=1 Tax=Methanocaldococcus vulcanius (strain ATCC 700851 / DSM 12094 / M7) TaxID=579137 RepID=C9RHI4_METVM|nr:TdeIII family type II restriction endonuclease [Methanocaldococcus vulcanius]ACX73036.1 Type II site-specific deoxyribonuclease [Methanocaldococcus vulcanius M7]
MPLSKDVIEKISIETIRVLKSRFDTISDGDIKIRNMPFHMAFLRAFYGKIGINDDNEALKFLTLSQWFHGLSTTLGQSYFENIAHILSNGEKKTFKNYKIKKSVRDKISEIINDLKSGERLPNVEEEDKELREATLKNSEYVNGLNFTADVYFEDRDKVVMIELKSVRPNAGEMRGEKQKILYGKAYMMETKPDKKVYYFIGFPYDPTENPENPCGYDKDRFMNSLIEFSKYFDKREVLIAEELWSFLSGEKKTMEKILDIINSIAKPDFKEKFDFINTFPFINQDRLYTKDAIDEQKFKKYIEILQEWKLYSEIECAKAVKELSLLKLPSKDRRIFERLINNSMFSSNNKYNENRRMKILELYKKYIKNTTQP